MELRRYVEARGWPALEYVDKGVSGAKDRRPALDQLLADARRRQFDVLVCWKLDRFGRNLKHPITLLDETQAVGIAFVSLAEGIDATTPAGKLQMHILGAIAEFERGRIRERIFAGIARARAQGKRLGRGDLRHEAGCRWLEAGLPPHHIQEMYGHANLSQTSTYLHAPEFGLRESMALFEASRVGKPWQPRNRAALRLLASPIRMTRTKARYTRHLRLPTRP